jgi:ParB family chromosome partitioning protein
MHVRQVVESLAALAKKINKEHHAGECARHEGLECYRRCGKLLLRAKKRLGHGKWLPWLKANIKVTQQRASHYMQLAKLQVTCNLEEEWQRISGNKAKGQAHVSRYTGEEEWFTPPAYLEAARAVLGHIDLDPASCDQAQINVQASKYYTKEQDGLTKHWRGKVWLNPPYWIGVIDQFVTKLVGHYEDGDVPEAVVLTNNSSETQWYHDLLKACCAICIVEGRIRFLTAKGHADRPLQGQTIFYLGANAAAFSREFRRFGVIMKEACAG